MLKNSKAKLSVFYCLVGLLGLCCATWLVFTLTNVGNDPIGQSQKQGDYLVAATSPSDDKPSLQHDLEQPKDLLDQIKEDASSIDAANPRQCSVRCSSTLSMLDDDVELDDDTFHKLRAYVKEIAAYLQHDESERQHYLQIALTTTDGDKRAFLTDIFRHLPDQQKVQISAHLIGSESWPVRADGVTLLTDHGSPTLDVANTLMAIFSSEENAYVKGSILNYLKQSIMLQGDAEILQQLDSVIYNGTDSLVRVAALNAKMQLSEQPYHILPDAVQALRASEPELQLAGLIAIDQLLKHEQEYIEDGVYIDRNSIKNDIQNIQNLAVYDGDMKRFDHLIKEANAIYLRYFEY